MADVWANSMACHTRATYHIAGCCHLVNSLSRFRFTISIHDSRFTPLHCRVQSPDEINVVIVPHCWCKNSIRHIEVRFRHILLFFSARIWRATAYVSSPIHLLNNVMTDVWTKTTFWVVTDGLELCGIAGTNRTCYSVERSSWGHLGPLRGPSWSQRLNSKTASHTTVGHSQKEIKYQIHATYGDVSTE